MFRKLALVSVLTFIPFVAASADPPGGPITGVTRVKAYSSNVHAVFYNGGEQADFAIVGDGDTTLNLIVTDQFGREIVRTRGPGDRAHVSWNVRFGATYYIRVVNEGPVYNEYTYRAY